VEGRLRDLVDVLQTASSFQLKRGMIEYLVMIADMRGEAVSMCKTVAKQGDLLMTANLLRKIKASPVEVVSIVEMCSTAITQVELNRVSLECIFDLGRPNVVRVEVDKHRITEPTRQPHIRKRRITEPTRQSHIYKRRITEPTRQSHIYKMLEPLAQAFVEREDVSSDTIISCVQHWVSGTEVSRVLAACVLRSAVASRPGMVTQTAKLLARAVDQHGHRWIMWTACVALERSGSTDESESDNGVRVSDATAWAEAVHNFGDANIAYQLPVVSTWLESGDKVLTAAAARVISTCKVPLHKGYESYYTSKRVIKRFLFLSRQLISSEERDIMRLRLAEATERYDQIMDG
jgi:hypothetical protein